MKNLILAGGRAREELSVLVPPGKNKVLLKIMGKPVIYYPLTNLQRVSRAETLLVYRVGEESVYREASQYSLETLTPIPQQSGETIHDAILAAKDKLNDTDHFFLVFGDIIVEQDAFSQLLSIHLSEEPDATLLAIPLEPRHIETYGLLSINEDSYVDKVLDKPISETTKPLYIAGGAYILPTWIIDLLEKQYTLPQALNEVASKGKVRAVYWSNTWIDIGYPSDLLEATYQLLSRIRDVSISGKAEIEKTAVIEGPVVIEDHAYIDHYVVIKGPAYIGDGAFIGTHSFIRDYTNIESKTRLGAYNEVRYSNIQSYTLMHSRVIVMDSLIGENTVFEPNITILNVLPEEEEPPRLRTHIVKKPTKTLKKMGAVIGYNVRINSGTIIKPGEIIEPNTIVGK
ncbi:MAG: nucleotidyl transferase [Desulfurococcales archaeon ex4484_58]|nr:MAG: nucleotidyl transferase [Desulfurococcales archaeon ex4484_58]